MKNLEITTAKGNVTVSRTKNGLQYELPMGLSGKDFAKIKDKFDAEIQAFKDECEETVDIESDTSKPQ